MDTITAIKNRIAEFCAARNLAFNALADISGVPHSTVKSIMNGASQNPGIVTIKKLCDGLDVSLAEFFNTETFRNLEQEIK